MRGRAGPPAKVRKTLSEPARHRRNVFAAEEQKRQHSKNNKFGKANALHQGYCSANPGPYSDMHGSCIIVCMRTTLNLDDELLTKARRLTGIEEKTALIHEALRTLISLHAARRLAALGGTQPNFRPGRRRRPKARQ